MKKNSPINTDGHHLIQDPGDYLSGSFAYTAQC